MTRIKYVALGLSAMAIVCLIPTITSASPGQKYYWVVQNARFGKTDQHLELWRTSNLLVSFSTLFCVWWTDYNGVDERIVDNGWHINTKFLVCAESTEDDMDAVLHITTYGESNYYPETTDFHVIYGNQPTAQFNVRIRAPSGDDTMEWWGTCELDGEPLFIEFGNVEDLAWINVEYEIP